MTSVWKVIKVIKVIGVIVGALITCGSAVASLSGVDIWKLAWQYWSLIGFTVFGVSLGDVIRLLHLENKRLKTDQIENIKRDPRFLAHCDALAQATSTLARFVDTLLRHKENSIVKGNLINGIEIVENDKTERLKIAYTFSVQYLEKHLKVDKEYPLKNLELTLETVTPELYKRLNTLMDSRVFGLVPECPVCKDLLED